jgi:hypothetical protein
MFVPSEVEEVVASDGDQDHNGEESDDHDDGGPHQVDRRRDPDRRYCHTPDDSMSRSVCSSCGKSPVWSDSEGSNYQDGQSEDEPEEEGALHHHRPVQSNPGATRASWIIVLTFTRTLSSSGCRGTCDCCADVWVRVGQLRQLEVVH